MQVLVQHCGVLCRRDAAAVKQLEKGLLEGSIFSEDRALDCTKRVLTHVIYKMLNVFSFFS